MGTFAVLSQDGLEVAGAHINLWCLPGGLGVSRFLLDVGLHIRSVAAADINSFGLLLPCGTEGTLQDLSPEMLDRATARLIFGHDVRVVQEQISVKQNQPFDVLRTSTSSEKDNDRSDRDYSYWSIELVKPLQQGQQGYMRMRFEVTGLGRVWNWKRHLLGRRGALIDFRIADFREMSVIPKWAELDDQVVTVSEVYLFVVLPAKFHLQVASPDLHYVRLLEGKAWESYVHRKVALFTEPKLAIYEWRDYEGVNTSNPMRVVLDTTREPPVGAGRSILVGAILTTLLVGLLWRLPLRFEWIHEAYGWLVGLGAATIFVGLLRAVIDSNTGRYLDWLRKAFRWVETALYRS